MSAYAEVDGTITQWMTYHHLSLQTKFGGAEARFCYVTGGAQECFQISIEPPEGEETRIKVWSIETIDDVELCECWAATSACLRDALDVALHQIKAWDARMKGPATWSEV